MTVDIAPFLKFFLHSCKQVISNSYYTLTKPYSTWRALSRSQEYGPTAILLLIAATIFAFRAPLRLGLNDPSKILLYSINFGLACIIIYLLNVLLIAACSQKFTRQNILHISITWIYSYLPTIIWFLMSQSSFLIVPPPRTSSPAGIIFSVLFASISVSLLTWKLLLLWLTFQVTCQLPPKFVIKSLLFYLPSILLVWIIFAKLHLWLIPFI